MSCSEQNILEQAMEVVDEVHNFSCAELYKSVLTLYWEYEERASMLIEHT